MVATETEIEPLSTYEERITECVRLRFLIKKDLIPQMRMRQRWDDTYTQWSEWLEAFHELRNLLRVADETLASGCKLTGRTLPVREIITRAYAIARGETSVFHQYSFSNRSCVFTPYGVIDHQTVIDYFVSLIKIHKK